MNNSRRRNFRSRPSKNNFRRRNVPINSNGSNSLNSNGNMNFSRNGSMNNIHNVEKTMQKYQQLAKDAQSLGDPVIVENYLQHVDHYSRRLAEISSKRESSLDNKPKENPLKNSEDKISDISEAEKIKTKNV